MPEKVTQNLYLKIKWCLGSSINLLKISWNGTQAYKMIRLSINHLADNCSEGSFIHYLCNRYDGNMRACRFNISKRIKFLTDSWLEGNNHNLLNFSQMIILLCKLNIGLEFPIHDFAILTLCLRLKSLSRWIRYVMVSIARRPLTVFQFYGRRKQ